MAQPGQSIETDAFAFPYIYIEIVCEYRFCGPSLDSFLLASDILTRIAEIRIVQLFVYAMHSTETRPA